MSVHIQLPKSAGVKFLIFILSLLLASAIFVGCSPQERETAADAARAPFELDSQIEEIPVPFTYVVEINGKILGQFTECYGIGSESEVIESKVMSSTGLELIKVQPGTNRWTPVTLRRGITSNLDIWVWRDKVIQGLMNDARMAMTISMLSPENELLAQWNFLNAWPSGLSGPMVPALGAEVGRHAVEELVIVHEGMERVK